MWIQIDQLLPPLMPQKEQGSLGLSPNHADKLLQIKYLHHDLTVLIMRNIQPYPRKQYHQHARRVFDWGGMAFLAADEQFGAFAQGVAHGVEDLLVEQGVVVEDEDL
jgi:hypothetical protein